MKTQPQELRVEWVPVGLIQPSPTNPRKRYDQGALQELAASIKSVGVQVPLSLRPIAGAKLDDNEDPLYEIVGGERRWRAAQLAGLAGVPAIVRVLSDAECREAQLIDNLQRADLSPMEEAEGYEALIREAGAEGFSIPDEQLAAKVGKPAGYVRSRRKLLELIPGARAALGEGFLTFGCALLIAKLQRADQEKAVVQSLRGRRQGVTAAEEVAHDKAWAAEHPDDQDGYYDGFTPISERDLKEWIADNVTLDLANASWPLDQPIEGVDAPPCQACPKRSGSDTALFAELTAKADVCTDPGCFAAKRKAFVQVTTAAAKRSGAPLLKLSTQLGCQPLKEGAELEKVKFKRGQWIEAEAGSCASAMQGITEEGQVLTVCVEPKCKVHKHSLIAGGSAGSAPKTDYEAESRKIQEARKAYVEREWPIRRAVYAEIRKKLTGAKLLRAVIADLLDHGSFEELAALRGLDGAKGGDWNAARKAVAAAFAKAKDAELESWLVDVVAARSVAPSPYLYADVKRDRSRLWELGKLLGVDCDAIAKKATAPVAKAKPTPAVKAATPAKKGQNAPKAKLSPEAKKRIADAMKKRWTDLQKKKAVRK